MSSMRDRDLEDPAVANAERTGSAAEASKVCPSTCGLHRGRVAKQE